MGASEVILLIFLIPCITTEETEVSPKAVVTRLSDWTDAFSGETVTLRCGIRGGEPSDWLYSFYKNGEYLKHVSSGPEFQIKWVDESHNGDYSCRATRNRDSQGSEISEAIRITVSAIPMPVLRGPPQIWRTEGDSVTLSCEVTGSTTGWRFHWFMAVPDSSAWSQISDSREAGGNYTLSHVALKHTGVYACKAVRGEPPYHTGFSRPQSLWVTSFSSLSSVVVSPNKTQHFTSESLSLGCVEQSGSFSEWRLRWSSGKMDREVCAGSTCRISSATQTDSGVYWCQSASGERSSPVNITVLTDGDVILESPAHPVTEGDPLTLRCRYRYQPSHISADFYKDGTLLQTSKTGEMTIPAVSKSHEGLYKCSNPEKGESPESWITVKVLLKPAPFSSLLLPMGCAGGLVIMLVLIIILFLLYRFKKLKVVNSGKVPILDHTRTRVSLEEVMGPNFPTATVVVVSPQPPLYPGDVVTLRCAIAYHISYKDWHYYWYRNGNEDLNMNKETISFRFPEEAGRYECAGMRKNHPVQSSRSAQTDIKYDAPPTATVVVVFPQSPFYSGERVTLKCDIAKYTDWGPYSWYRDNSPLPSQASEFITITLPQEAGQYQCSGQRKDRPHVSSLSEHHHIGCKEKPTPSIRSDRVAPVFTGNSLNLRCDMDKSTGWTFYWYRNTQTSDPVALTDGDSYSISSVNVSDGGQYWCRAGRGDPVYYTQYSNDVWVVMSMGSL
ncbi:Fc receptor-like protein 5 [Sardina pilchardus]|uniref:Fc receptor-like protein 5 n=1 Tax=Sardina pilchardus TaxID=27697 RepID=UPI002E0EB8B0